MQLRDTVTVHAFLLVNAKRKLREFTWNSAGASLQLKSDEDKLTTHVIINLYATMSLAHHVSSIKLSYFPHLVISLASNMLHITYVRW